MPRRLRPPPREAGECRKAWADVLGKRPTPSDFLRSHCSGPMPVTDLLADSFLFGSWGKLFHNAVAACAIAVRPVHKRILIKILGKSKRSNEGVE